MSQSSLQSQISPPAAVWHIKRWETKGWSDVLSSLSAHSECFHLQDSICLDSCSHTQCMARRMPGSWRNQERTCSLPCRGCHHSQRGLPGWHRRRGKLTYKRHSCCWHCRKGLRKRKMSQEEYFGPIWRNFYGFYPKKDGIKMSKTETTSHTSFFYSIVLAGILCDSECVQHHTTVQLLPPGSQCDVSLLTDCSVCFVTGATQFWTALLGTQVEYAVAEEHTCIFRNSPIASGNFLETYFS